jgi:enoyl-CoA hydratase/carnithine racemase
VNEMATERTESILRIQLNRPQKKNAMTSNMYVSIVQLLNDPAGDDRVHLVPWHGV